ncbi:hypothetical protein CNX70_07935 [Janthinobacterium svalbardensis]|uniref:Uncharacterized protein n=1 Tax=Janthinobacterium svalbardensis TaxID=368607 RepID=A0A290WTV6_9BURK|nr:hypothetical protein CNX70_07935 [Janthinobacterium svalbardensis]
MTLSLVNGFGSEFTLVVGEAAQDQEAEKPGTGALKFFCVAFDFVNFIRCQTNAKRFSRDALRSAPRYGYVFHNVMMCNRYRMA